jgi:hypothetical protein
MPARKKTPARRIGVKVTLQVFQLSKAGTAMDLHITEHGQMLGNLTIGRGSLTWRGSGRAKSKRIGWLRFAQMMNKLAYGE